RDVLENDALVVVGRHASAGSLQDREHARCIWMRDVDQGDQVEPPRVVAQKPVDFFEDAAGAFGRVDRLDARFGPDARTPNEDREVVRQEPTPFVVPSTAEAPDEIFAREPSAGRRDLDRVRHYRTAPVAE